MCDGSNRCRVLAQGKTMANALTALGMVSGTILDGIDIALVVTDGEKVVSRGPSMTVAYPADFRERLAAGPRQPCGSAGARSGPACLASSSGS